jgi:hypothetical protein
MPQNVAQKLITAHLVDGTMRVGTPIALKGDHWRILVGNHSAASEIRPRRTVITSAGSSFLLSHFAHEGGLYTLSDAVE